MSSDLKDQTALITGASRGIGRSIAIELAKAEVRTIVSSRYKESLEILVKEIKAIDGKALAIPADISNENDVSSLFETIQNEVGSLDILINNAGLGLFGKVADFSIENFDRVINTNLRGTFLCCQEAMKMMIPREKGYIINISSVVGIKGYPNQAAYTASKHGIMGLTKSLSVEAQQHGIRVSAILPGGVDTDLASSARPDLDRSILLQPEDITQSVLFLLSLSERAAIDQIYIRRRNSAPF